MERWRIFGEVLEPGAKRQLSLHISMGGLSNRGQILPGMRNSADYEMPAILVNGARPGKTLLVTAGIHSGEYNGIPATIRVARELDPERMSGRAILLPCVNTSGFWTLHPRTLPEDGFNLNSQYPGSPNGTVGERLADFFVREIFPQVDFVLDFHGGSRGERMTPMAFFPTHAPVREAALAAAMAMNIGFLVESQATNGEYSYAAASMGIPGLLIERGEGYFCEPEWIEDDRRDLLLLLEHLGICSAPSGIRDPSLNRRVFREAIYLEAERDGLWYPAVKKDQPVSQGQLLGTLENLFGDVLETVCAKCDGHVLYLNCGLAIPKGELLVAYAVAASLE